MSFSRKRPGLLVALASLVLGACAGRMPPPVDSAEGSAHDFAAACLRAFENLDMPGFIECFAEDATVFFPGPEAPMRYNGRQAVREQFQVVFDAIQGSSTAGPPYHHLDPELLRVQLLGDDAAIVSFHLVGPSRLARRTFVLHREGRRWLIVHLHASNMASR
jgi:ketosteroid isomerase-like protein